MMMVMMMMMMMMIVMVMVVKVICNNHYHCILDLHDAQSVSLLTACIEIGGWQGDCYSFS